MTTAEMFANLVRYAGDDYDSSQDSFLNYLIDSAIEEVVRVMYPTGFSSAEEQASQEETALARYPYKIQRICEYHYDKAGKEGVTAYSENSTSANYEVAGTPPSMLTQIIPVSRVV